jgi:hypothetical protein
VGESTNQDNKLTQSISRARTRVDKGENMSTKVLPIVKIVDDYGIQHNINAYTISDISENKSDVTGNRDDTYTVRLTNGCYLVISIETAFSLLNYISKTTVSIECS